MVEHIAPDRSGPMYPCEGQLAGHDAWVYCVYSQKSMSGANTGFHGTGYTENGLLGLPKDKPRGYSSLSTVSRNPLFLFRRALPSVCNFRRLRSARARAADTGDIGLAISLCWPSADVFVFFLLFSFRTVQPRRAAWDLMRR